MSARYEDLLLLLLRRGGMNAAPVHGAPDYSRLDEVVMEYLSWRGYRQSMHTLNGERKTVRAQSQDDQRQIVERILASVLSGDYPRALLLWDSYIVQVLPGKSASLNSDARTIEFILNLFLAVYPFRTEVIKDAQSPKVASATAARSMTIFKHYLEAKGARLTQQDQEFEQYKTLHKIAFPPTHPQFKHLFSEEWTKMVKQRISSFLERFFSASEPPLLCSMYATYDNQPTFNNMKSSFKNREAKIFEFSKSLADITNELVSTVESGKDIDKKYLLDFRRKFDSLRDALRLPTVDNSIPKTVVPVLRTLNDKISSIGSSSGFSPKALRRTLDECEHMAKSACQARNVGNVDAEGVTSIISSTCEIVDLSLKGLFNPSGSEQPVTSQSLQSAYEVWKTSLNCCVILRPIIRVLSLSQAHNKRMSAARESCILQLIRLDVLGISSAQKKTKSKNNNNNFTITGFFQTFATTIKNPSLNVLPEVSSFESMDRLHEAHEDDDNMHHHNYIVSSSEALVDCLCRLIISLGFSEEGLEYLMDGSAQLVSTLMGLMLGLFQRSYPNSNGDAGNPVELSLENVLPVHTRLMGRWKGLGMLVVMALSALAALSKQNQLSIIKHHCMSYISKSVSEILTERIDDQALRYIDACFTLAATCLQSLESSRVMVASTKKMKETETFMLSILRIVTIAESRIRAEIAVAILRKLFGEIVTRQVARELKEFAEFFANVKDGKVHGLQSEDVLSMAQKLYSDVVDTAETNAKDSVDLGKVVSLVYNVLSGIRDLEGVEAQWILLGGQVSGGTDEALASPMQTPSVSPAAKRQKEAPSVSDSKREEGERVASEVKTEDEEGDDEEEEDDVAGEEGDDAGDDGDDGEDD